MLCGVFTILFCGLGQGYVRDPAWQAGLIRSYLYGFCHRSHLSVPLSSRRGTRGAIGMHFAEPTERVTKWSYERHCCHP
jgi:hypothetical protein